MKSDCRPKAYILAVEEMAARGMVTSTEIAQRLKVDPATLRKYRENGTIHAELRKDIRMYFYSKDLQIPGRGKRMRRRSRARAEAMFYRGDSTPPGGEQIPLGPWAMWPAPGLVRMAGRRYRVAGADSYGWLGGLAKPA